MITFGAAEVALKSEQGLEEGHLYIIVRVLPGGKVEVLHLDGKIRTVDAKLLETR